MAYYNNHMMHDVHYIESVTLYTPSPLFMMYICQAFYYWKGLLRKGRSQRKFIVNAGLLAITTI